MFRPANMQEIIFTDPPADLYPTFRRGKRTIFDGIGRQFVHQEADGLNGIGAK